MKTFLLDINVLLALGWSHHVHHNLAHAWLGNLPPCRLAHCTVTQLGFVRIGLLTEFSPAKASVADLRARLNTFFAAHDSVFLREPENGIHDHNLTARIEAVLTSSQLTDAYLAGLADLNKAVVATLDKSLVTRHRAVAELLQA